jgi:hypothetical protein
MITRPLGPSEYCDGLWCLPTAWRRASPLKKQETRVARAIVQLLGIISMLVAIDAQVGLLDELLSRLAHSPQSMESEIAQEHFQAARVYLLGAMYGEFGLTLELGRRAVHAIQDRKTRSELNHVLSQLIDASIMADFSRLVR